MNRRKIAAIHKKPGARIPASARKLAAARANGAKAAGAKTDAGKARSAQNARTHGLCAETLALAAEDLAQYHELHKAYVCHFQPRDAVESDLVDVMVNAKWRQRRSWLIETEVLNQQMAASETDLAAKFHVLPEKNRIAMAFESHIKESSALPLLQRYEGGLSREYYRALKTLREMQAAPLAPPCEAELRNDANPDSEHTGYPLVASEPEPLIPLSQMPRVLTTGVLPSADALQMSPTGVSSPPCPIPDALS